MWTEQVKNGPWTRIPPDVGKENYYGRGKIGKTEFWSDGYHDKNRIRFYMGKAVGVMCAHSPDSIAFICLSNSPC